ncbi:MAG: putative methylase [Clostridia bacterium]|nr:putative methylase [Clostridia bacterium]
MQDNNNIADLRLIEAGFPCHQVGAETQRERGASSALPPLYFLHVWWARRPLTPSRAAILASLLPAGTDPDWFLRQLGIEKVVALVNGEQWTLTGSLLASVEKDSSGAEWLPVDKAVLHALRKEEERRDKNRKVIQSLCQADPAFVGHPVITRWQAESRPLPQPWPQEGAYLPILRLAADPAHVNERIEFRQIEFIKKVLGDNFKWDDEDLYAYNRAFVHCSCPITKKLTVLDPTAGGGSIPFEAMRLGCTVVANDLNPVATIILYGTLKYPAYYGIELVKDIKKWGDNLLYALDEKIHPFFPRIQPLPLNERSLLESHLKNFSDLITEYDKEEIVDYIYVRQVTCPHCGGEAPLLNTCWLAKEGDKWGVRVIPDGRPKGGKVRFETYRIKGNRGPNGEDPNFATVSNGVGICVHCRQAIPAEEIKAQARGESPHGKWQDRLYCVVAVRYQPKLDKNGRPRRYQSGARAGEIMTEKIRFFRPPNDRDLAALAAAEQRLQECWPAWERQGLIPTEGIPAGNDMRPVIYGMTRWCDLFTPRQLLGHLTLVAELNRLKPEILQELGEERGRAVVTYLQLMIDKYVDYNSKQTMWHASRGVIGHTFTRHDFSLKWTFGEMVFTGPHSGAAWALAQVIDAYAGIAELVAPLHQKLAGSPPPVTIRCGTAARLEVPDRSVDLICMDPPYYNNVQYAELSDYFYVWQRRTLQDLYPEIFRRRLTNKTDEAVANPARDGSAAGAAQEYERLMGEIFAEGRRVLKDEGLLTIMFTHKTQAAWEALTRSLIENGWIITSSLPVESEAAESIHQKDNAAAASSIFLTCRKRASKDTLPAIWSGFGGTGVAARIREAVREGLEEFATLRLNPVDEMVAGYGRALRVLSEHWPVLDGDEPVSPIRAMNEASAVVARYQIARLTGGWLQVDDLNPEAAMALILYGIFGLAEFAYDEALNLSRSLNISLEARAGGYTINGPMIGINDAGCGRQARRSNAEDTGCYAPLVRRGSKLRLARPEERSRKRLDNPQTEWDILHGLVLAYREGDIPVARAYLARHAPARERVVLDLLAVWAGKTADENLRREGEAILFGLR